jgi:hypothetical protein
MTRDDCDGRIGAGGFHSGGCSALLLAAADERVSCAVTSGWYYGFKDAYLMHGDNCPCNIVPFMWKYFDCADIGAMIAPRPLYIESGTNDPHNGPTLGYDNVTSQVSITKDAYESLGAAENLLHTAHDSGGIWRGDYVLDFLEKVL